MKNKILLILLLSILFLPFITNAKNCDDSKITIIAMEKNDIEGNLEEVHEPTFSGKHINLNLKMYEVGDSISYDMSIKNDSNENYMLDDNSFKTTSKNILYILKTNDGTNVVKANSIKNVTLIVKYNKEVDNVLLDDNKFDASNNVKLSLSTSEKEKKLDFITTNDIKNPLTGSSLLYFTIFILLIVATIIYFKIHRKKNYFFIIILSIVFIPTVYAVCKVDIVLESKIEIEKIPKLFDTIIGLPNETNGCVTKYDGDVTDEVGKTVRASNVYFDRCSNKRNVIFGNQCWQVIRTTETGGIKLIYNGEPVNGKCESSREMHKGIVGKNNNYQTLSSSYLYGSSFTYDLSTNEFTLSDTITSTWSDSTYEDLIGMFTCKTTSDNCSTLYQINGYKSNTQGYSSAYIITDTNYGQIGKSSYNAFYKSPSRVGYMFNKSYETSTVKPGTNTSKFGSTFTYSNGTYTLSGTTQNISNWSSEYNQINNTHYTCWNTSGTCSTISYVFYANSREAEYFNMSGGKSIDDILDEMLFSNDVNRYNSSIKGIIDAWYAQNLLTRTNMIEDTVYCNSRNIIDLGSFNPNGGSTMDFLQFKNHSSTTNLSCLNYTDQFAISNNKAKLKFPVSLISNEEWENIGEDSLRNTNDYYWSLSPFFFSDVYYASMRSVASSGMIYFYRTDSIGGVRPAVTLKPNTIILSGTGSEIEPWIIKE